MQHYLPPFNELFAFVLNLPGFVNKFICPSAGIWYLLHEYLAPGFVDELLGTILCNTIWYQFMSCVCICTTNTHTAHKLLPNSVAQIVVEYL